MKTIRVSPELVADMLAEYMDNHPGHIEGKLQLEVLWNSWRHFEKEVSK